MLSHIMNIVMVVYLLVFIFFAEKIYFFTLSFFAKRELNSLGYELEDLKFSFDQVSYLVATPSSNCHFCDLSKDDYYIQKARRSPFSPKSFALKIFAKMPTGEEKLIAILDKDRFPVPMLDALLYYDQIDKRGYSLIISYLFYHYKTHELIIEEVMSSIIEG